VIPVFIAWCVVSSILSTSDYFLLWWIGVGLLLALNHAFTYSTASAEDDSYKRLRPNIIECKIIDWLIQRDIRWWQIPKWCWLRNVYQERQRAEGRRQKEYSPLFSAATIMEQGFKTPTETKFSGSKSVGVESPSDLSLLPSAFCPLPSSTFLLPRN
jgi:hypothetical protein